MNYVLCKLQSNQFIKFTNYNIRNNIDFIEDPSNKDFKYTRPVIRQILNQMESKFCLEYIWVGGNKELRSKTKVMDINPSLDNKDLLETVFSILFSVVIIF